MDKHDEKARETVAGLVPDWDGAYDDDELIASIATALRAAAAEGAGEWLPIGMAPRDGTPIWLFSRGAYWGIPFVGSYSPSFAFFPEQPWLVLPTRNRLYEHVPTHWMHISRLPEPPATDEREK